MSRCMLHGLAVHSSASGQRQWAHGMIHGAVLRLRHDFEAARVYPAITLLSLRHRILRLIIQVSEKVVFEIGRHRSTERGPPDNEAETHEAEMGMCRMHQPKYLAFHMDNAFAPFSICSLRHIQIFMFAYYTGPTQWVLLQPFPKTPDAVL